MARPAGWRALQLGTGLAAAVLAALLSRLAVSRLWTFVPADFPERFPWGTPVTPERARFFEEIMGFLVLGLLLVCASQLLLVPWLRTRLERRP
jgi:hypothetical protein